MAAPRQIEATGSGGARPFSSSNGCARRPSIGERGGSGRRPPPSRLLEPQRPASGVKVHEGGSRGKETLEAASQVRKAKKFEEKAATEVNRMMKRTAMAIEACSTAADAGHPSPILPPLLWRQRWKLQVDVSLHGDITSFAVSSVGP